MPKHRDATIEGHILNAAYDLLARGGEHALTMRAVAKAAGTTTPTVYHRFKDKRDLAEVVRRRAVENLVAFIAPACSPEETCLRLLDFAVANPNLYRLFTADWAVRLGRNDPKPSFDLIKKRLAERLGGSLDDHWDLAMALGALVHGTATVLLAEGVDQAIVKRLRRVCGEGCEALIEHAARDSRAPSRGGS
ncbi:MAG TPA: helix-turn-helix domain-containing protein [Candidatus Acidoferrum sp.]|nr:helix-turn-helix domain-containing protein [Candidatus Acidoferrum sp.]